jgi:excisionase family DNA binding protein
LPMSPQEKNPHMNKKFIQIESVSSDDFKKSILEDIALLLDEKCDCCNEPDTTSKEWLTSKEACKYFKVSQPTLKRMRERGEGENRRVGKSFRYLRV